jgi:hypothetical protein
MLPKMKDRFLTEFCRRSLRAVEKNDNICLDEQDMKVYGRVGQYRGVGRGAVDEVLSAPPLTVA